MYCINEICALYIDDDLTVRQNLWLKSYNAWVKNILSHHGCVIYDLIKRHEKAYKDAVKGESTFVPKLNHLYCMIISLGVKFQIAAFVDNDKEAASKIKGDITSYILLYKSCFKRCARQVSLRAKIKTYHHINKYFVSDSLSLSPVLSRNRVLLSKVSVVFDFGLPSGDRSVQPGL